MKTIKKVRLQTNEIKPKGMHKLLESLCQQNNFKSLDVYDNFM